MDKKISPMKIIAVIFCLAAVAVMVMLVVLQIYTGGQMKTIDKLYSSLTHGIYSDYSDCFAEGTAYYSENDFDKYRSSVEHDWGDDFKLSAKFISRKDNSHNVEVTVRETVYNDSSSETIEAVYTMVRQNGKWLISDSKILN